MATQFDEMDVEMALVGTRYVRAAINRTLDGLEAKYQNGAPKRRGRPPLGIREELATPSVREAILAAPEPAAPQPEKKKRVLSAKGRANIRRALKKRWADKKAAAAKVAG